MLQKRITKHILLNADALKIFRNFVPELRAMIFEWYFADEENWEWVWGDQWDKEWDNDNDGSPDTVYKLDTTALIETLRTADHGLYREVCPSSNYCC